MSDPIYLDHHATTPLDPRVHAAMEPFLGSEFGNPSSTTHVYGRRARAAVERAREQVAAALGARPGEIVFTSCATESDNIAVKGAARAHRSRGDHVVCSAIEHKAVLRSCASLEREGFRVTRVRPGADGVVSADSVRDALTERTILVSLLHVNSEIGTVQPVAEVGRLCRERGVLFHCDAVQALGHFPVDVETLGCDLLALSAHKFYGPKGVGVLYVRRGTRIEPLFDGGGQERDLRPGTLHAAGIVGCGEASALADAEREVHAPRLRVLRDRLWAAIRESIPGTHLNGAIEPRHPGNLNVSFEGVEGESLLLALERFALSSGSACTSDSVEPSYVIVALGVPEELALCSIRVGIGRSTTEEHVDLLAQDLRAQVERLRAMSPLRGRV